MQKKTKTKVKTKKGTVVVKAKRKSAVARTVAKKGTGKVTINKKPLETVSSKYIRLMIKEPLMLAPAEAKEIDFDITAKGGGNMAQAIASRATIAKSIVELTKNEKTKKMFLEYDRLLLVDDVRRVESKKPLGPKARAKKQRSKR